MLSEGAIIFTILWSGATALFLYAAYWALIIRKVLLTNLYRRQALWTAAMGIYFVTLAAFLTIVLTLQLYTLETNILGGLVISSGSILEFLWIDSTVRIARRSDPLLRDTLHWSKLRYFLWIGSIGGAASAMITAITLGFSTVGAISGEFGGALLIGAIALFLSGRRSGDVTLRHHLTWAASCIFLLWLVGQSVGPLFRIIVDSYTVQSIIFPLVAAGAFCLYKSARSLIPIGHLSLEAGISNDPSPLAASTAE